MSELEQALRQDGYAKVYFGDKFATLEESPVNPETIHLEAAEDTLAWLRKSWSLDQWQARFLPTKSEGMATSEVYQTVYEVLEMLDGKREWRKDPEA